MNRRQEVAAWVFGLLLCGVSLHFGNDLLFEYIIPILVVVGQLAIYSLRTRGASGSGASALVAKGGAAILAVAVLGHIDQVLTSSSLDLETLQGEVEDLQATAAEARDAAEETASKVDDLAIEIDDLRR